MRGLCRPEDLRALPDVPTLVFSDCEGAEDDLLDPEEAPILRHSTVIAEMHEALVPGVEKRLLERFAPTHEVETLSVERRFAGQHEALTEVEGLNYMQQEILLTEFRTLPVKWAVMTPRDGLA